MIAKASVRRLRILIGPDQQNWSAHCGVLSIGRTGLADESNPGKIPLVGTLEIKPTLTIPESIDPVVNPIRWNPGSDIYVQVRNNAGTGWIDTSFSRLKILRTPRRPGRGSLTLDVGCRIQWGNQSQFDDDRSGVIYGQSERCDVVAQRLIEASGIDAPNITLSEWPYSLDRPIGKRQNSFLNQAADLAYANNWRYLYQRVDGGVTDAEFTLTSGTATSTIAIGQNDIFYEPSGDGERPAEITKVAGTGYELETIENPSVDIEETNVNFNDISPNSFGEGVGERIITTQSFSAGANPAKTKRVQVFRAEALVFQDFDIPSQLVEVSDTTETATYESGKIDPTTARLLQKNTVELRKGKTLLPTDEPFNMRQIYSKREDMTYGAGEPMERYQSIEKQAAIILDENAANPWDEVTTEDLDYSWAEVSKGKFNRTDKGKSPLIRIRSNLNRETTNPEALLTKVKKYNRNGPNKPFATEFFDAGIDEDPTEFEGEAKYTPPGGPSGLEKERLFTVADGMGFSHDQMTALAAKHRDLIIGRERSYEIELAISDALLQSPPLPEIHVTDVDGNTYKYLGDALSFEFEQTRATAFCFGIWIEGGYQNTVNIAARIPSAALSVNIIQSSFSITATIPAGQILFVTTTGFNVAASSPSGALTIAITQELSIAATIPAGQLAGVILPELVIAAQIPAGELSAVILRDIEIAASIPQGTFTPVISETFEIAAVIPTGQLTANIGDDPDYAAFAARLSGTYTTAQQDSIQTFFVTLKNAGIYAKGDAAYIHALGTEADSLLNIFGTAYTAINNGLTFTAFEGLSGNGTSAYADSGFNPSTAANPNYTLNAGSLASYVRLNINGSGAAIAARTTSPVDTISFIQPRTSNNESLWILNARQSAIRETNTDCRGLNVVSRTSASLTTAYRRALPLGTSSEMPDGLVSANFYIGAYNNAGTAVDYSTNQHAFTWIGGGLSASEVTVLNDAVTDLLTVFGANV